MKIECQNRPSGVLTGSIPSPLFFPVIPLLSKTDCATFHLGWFHATGSARGGAGSSIRSRQDSSLPRSPRNLPTVLGEDAIPANRRTNGKMGARALCLVLSELPSDSAGRLDRSRRSNLGHANERRRRQENRKFPILRNQGEEGRGKEVSPEANHRAYLECVLSDRATGN